MYDLISRQAAIDAINKAFERVFAWDGTGPLGDKVLKNVPSTQPEQRWIPCSERYPEENQICIVTDETMRNTYEYRFCKETYDENQGWTYLRHRIIAWMPLPKPYKGEQESER